MLTSMNEQDRAECVIAKNPADPTPIGSHDRPELCGEIDLRSLPAGTLCVVDTRNSQYHVTALGRGPEALVEGGRHFKQLATAPLVGSIVGGHRCGQARSR